MRLSFFLTVAAFYDVSASPYPQNLSTYVNKLSPQVVNKQINNLGRVRLSHQPDLWLLSGFSDINTADLPSVSVFKLVNLHDDVRENAPSGRMDAPLAVSGKVIDEKGQPLAGVTVKLKGSSLSTSTSGSGNYAIRVPDGTDTLVFSFVGFDTQEVAVENRQQINVTLKELAKGLSDVVVVGYGQQKKVSLIGAISTVKAEELKLPVANLTNLLAGRVAGIIGVQRSGQPGYDNSDIYIRGISTFTNSRPLVLVDGIERDFANVDPEDIASFSILKDASATAVYGVRGANGVIIIQTKKGKIGKTLINAQYDQGITQFTKIPKFADGVTYLEMANEAYKNSNPNDPLPKYSQERIANTASGKDPDLYPNVNWFDVLFNKFGQNRRARINANGVLIVRNITSLSVTTMKTVYTRRMN